MEPAFLFSAAPAAVALLAILALALFARRQAQRAQRLHTSLDEIGRRHAEEAALAAERARAVAGLTAALETERAQSRTLAVQLAEANATLEQERRQTAETLRLLRDDRALMEQRFTLLADAALTRQGATLKQQSKEQLDAVLGPLREKIVEFQQGLQTAHTESVTARALLSQQIARLSEDSAKVRSEAESLAAALRGNVQTQGAWGEMLLGSILERSGLRAGEEYVVQQSHATEDGGRLRSDAIVNVPGGQRIVIDSKVSLIAFEAYVAAASEEERAPALARHVAAMRAQIRLLSGKAYHAIAEGSLDYVVMFVPIEGALAAALQADPEITSFALQSNVCIATPTTLMIALRTAANVWSVERRNRNAEQIAERAGRLHDKMVAFVEDMTALGGRLDQARGAYDGAMRKLATGNGNVLRQVQQLKDMGAKTTKSLPPALLDDAAEDADIAAAAS